MGNLLLLLYVCSVSGQYRGHGNQEKYKYYQEGSVKQTSSPGSKYGFRSVQGRIGGDDSETNDVAHRTRSYAGRHPGYIQKIIPLPPTLQNVFDFQNNPRTFPSRHASRRPKVLLNAARSDLGSITGSAKGLMSGAGDVTNGILDLGRSAPDGLVYTTQISRAGWSSSNPEQQFGIIRNTIISGDKLSSDNTASGFQITSRTSPNAWQQWTRLGKGEGTGTVNLLSTSTTSTDEENYFHGPPQFSPTLQNEDDFKNDSTTLSSLYVPRTPEVLSVAGQLNSGGVLGSIKDGAEVLINGAGDATNGVWDLGRSATDGMVYATKISRAGRYSPNPEQHFESSQNAINSDDQVSFDNMASGFQINSRTSPNAWQQWTRGHENQEKYKYYQEGSVEHTSSPGSKYGFRSVQGRIGGDDSETNDVAHRTRSYAGRHPGYIQKTIPLPPTLQNVLDFQNNPRTSSSRHASRRPKVLLNAARFNNFGRVLGSWGLMNGAGDVTKNVWNWGKSAGNGLLDATQMAGSTAFDTVGIGRNAASNLGKHAAVGIAYPFDTVSGAVNTGMSSVQKVMGSVGHATGPLVKGIGDLSSNVAWMTGNALKQFAVVGLKVGGVLIQPPLQGTEKVVNLGSFLTSLGYDISGDFVTSLGSLVQSGWGAVKAVEFPGKEVVLYLPEGAVSVVNEATKTIGFIATTTGKTIIAAEAVSLYMALNVVSAILGTVMSSLRMDCVRLKPQTQQLDSFMVDEISTSKGKVCGISNLKPMNNVTITNDDVHFLIIDVPHILENLTCNFEAVNVTNFSGTVLENAHMSVKIKQVFVKGTVFFQAGTIIRFMSIHLRVREMKGLDLKFKDTSKTGIMDIVENIGSVVAPRVTEAVNKKLREIEKRIARKIRGT